MTEQPIDAVRMMRQIRDRLSREFMDMSYEEQRRYLDEHLKPRTGTRQADSEARVSRSTYPAA